MKTVLKQTLELNAHGVDEASEKIADTLAQYPYISKRTILRLRLSAEEILLGWLGDSRGLSVELIVEEKGRWLDLLLILNGVSHRISPPGDGNATGLADSLLAELGIDWIYQFDRGQNSAYISVEAKSSNMVRNYLIAMLLGVIMAALLRLAPAEICETLQSSFISPLISLTSRFLTAIVTPMMLISAICGVLNVGSPRTLNRVGRFACSRFLLSMMVTVLCAGAVCALCFPFDLSIGDDDVFGFLIKFLSEIVPENIVSPIIDGNMIQVVAIGFAIGTAMLFLQRRVGLTARIVEEANIIVLKMLAGFEKLLPAVIFLSMLDTGLSVNVKSMLGYVKMSVLFLLFVAISMAAQFFRVSRASGISVSELIQILKPSFIVQLASATSSTAFSEAYDACEKRLGISRTLTDFALPVGTVIHKPMIAAEFVFVITAAVTAGGDSMDLSSMLTLMLLALLMSAAYPPVSGGEISCYTMLLLQMGLSTGQLAAACTLSSLFDILEAPTNTLSTELQLLLTAERHGLTDRQRSGFKTQC